MTHRQRSWSNHAVPRLMHVETGWMRVLSSTNEQGNQRVECILSAQNGVNTVEVWAPQGTSVINYKDMPKFPECTALCFTITRYLDICAGCFFEESVKIAHKCDALQHFQTLISVLPQ